MLNCTAEPDQTITLETVLLVQHNSDVTIGQPFIIDGATVGTVMRHLSQSARLQNET